MRMILVAHAMEDCADGLAEWYDVYDLTNGEPERFGYVTPE